MGLSRNKVAVSEGAAGSPPFYGESNSSETLMSRNRKTKTNKQRDRVVRKAVRKKISLVVRFSGTILRNREKPERNTIEHTYGGVAQLGEHLPCKQGVMGSNPIISTRVQDEAKEEKLKLLKVPRGQRKRNRDTMGS